VVIEYLHTEFHSNRTNRLASSSAYIHTHRHFSKTTFLDSGDLKDHRKHKISKSIFSGLQYFHYTTYMSESKKEENRKVMFSLKNVSIKKFRVNGKKVVSIKNV